MKYLLSRAYHFGVKGYSNWNDCLSQSCFYNYQTLYKTLVEMYFHLEVKMIADMNESSCLDSPKMQK
jgi:hypothetical protein